MHAAVSLSANSEAMSACRVDISEFCGVRSLVVQERRGEYRLQLYRTGNE